MGLEHADERAAGELCALIGVEDLWSIELCEGFLQSLDAEVRCHAVGEPPGEDFAAEPINDRHQITKPRAIEIYEISAAQT